MHKLTQLLTLSLVLAATSACTVPKLLAGPQALELRSGDEVSNCKLMGSVTGQHTDRYNSSRTDKTMITEVLNSARKEAENIGGNVLVEDGELVMGRQSFTVYSCP